MFCVSVKQLFRKPGQALIFFLLIAASTALLVFSAVLMTETNQRIDAAESQFTTIATVTQNWQAGDEILHADMLNFEDAEYINPPETRPLLMTYNPELYTTSTQSSGDSIHLVSFTPLADCSAMDELVDVEIQEVYYDWYDSTKNNFGSTEKALQPGNVIGVHQLFDPIVTLEVGKTYIANLSYIEEQAVFEAGYIPNRAPFSTQHSSSGEMVEGGITREGGILTDQPRIEEVTENFWDEEGRGEDWLNWVQALENERHTSHIPVLPTNSLTLLPAFHSNQAYISSGREITQEEFEKGEKVCILPRELMVRNALKVGDKIDLSMRFAMYGFVPGESRLFHFNLDYSFSPLDAQGNLYKPFWEAEYEIVGEYKQLREGANELNYDVIIVPSNSIGAGWEENIAYYEAMNGMNTSFQIPNGKIAEFNAALYRAVPNAAKLKIVYDDNGYEDIIGSLKNARLSAFLLLGVGCFSVLIVVILLLYFLVVKERKRTAVERSMGVSRNGCRVSMLAGILVLTLPAVILGSYGSWLVLEAESNSSNKIVVEAPAELNSMETAYFSREFSLWAENEHNQAGIQLDDHAVHVQKMVYVAVPLSVLLIVLILAMVMINRSIQIEPIMLLGAQNE